MSINDYEPLNILDNNTNSKIYKVRNKNTGEHFVWYTIDCENTSNQLINLQERFITRKELQHPNLLDFYDLIKENATFYLVVKYCKHGSLKDLMDIIYNDNKRFSEEFLCKILYQIAFTIKTIDITTNFDIKHIYFDEDYNVKFFNFDIANNETVKLKSQRISSLGALIFEICTLTKFSKKHFDKELKNCNNLYSKEFLCLLITTIKDSRDLKKNIDKVMCNSTLLLKITQWHKYKCFLKIDQPKCSKSNENIEDIYALQIEKLKEKEISLQQKEKMLKEMEHKLSIREKKVTSMEKLLRDNIKQAEETKNCNCSSRGPIKENLDSTYISCGDSVVMPTSKKLNVREIIKPATFTRTLSEKRIRFKGHSPLKDIDFNRRRSVRHTRFHKDVYVKTGEWTTCSEDTEKTEKKGTNKKCKQLFPTYENNSNVIVNKNVAKSLQWTEENKKYAFELLRLMNKENKPTDVKHTYL